MEELGCSRLLRCDTRLHNIGISMSGASMISTHLNVPYGPIVSTQDVVVSLRNGHFSASTKEANDILSALFIEVSCDLILRCAREVGASTYLVDQLYRESVRLIGHRNPEWEKRCARLLADDKLPVNLVLTQAGSDQSR